MDQFYFVGVWANEKFLRIKLMSETDLQEAAKRWPNDIWFLVDVEMSDV